MEKCKFCDTQLEEGVTVCPGCGKDNAREEALQEVTPDQEEASVQEQISAEKETAAQEEETAEKAVSEDAEEGEAEEAAQSEEAGVEPTPIQEGITKVSPGKIALAVAAIVVVVALIIALLVGGMAGKTEDAAASVPGETVETVAQEPTVPPTTPADTGADDETCKGSYSVTDEQALAGADTVVATMGDVQLTNAQLQLYYWNYVGSFISSEYGYQTMMYGMMDLARPLDTQISLADEKLTWQQYFLKCAIQNWQTIQAVALEAESQGRTIDAETQAHLDGMPGDLELTAQQYGLASVEELLKQNMGAGVTIDHFMNYQRTYYQGAPYFTEQVAAFTATQEEIAAFFEEHEEDYRLRGVSREDKVVDVRHVLIMPEGATSQTIRSETFSEEAWAAAETEANALLESWLAGEKTEDSFAALANEHTDDGNDANMDGQPDGGLYTGVTKGQMVEAFENWCFDAGRKTGDTGVVKTEFGYHIMYYVQGEEMWPLYAEQDLLAMKENELLLSIVDKHPMEVDYNAIQLAAITLQ